MAEQTIYRWGLTYGGGVRVRLTNTLGFRLDFRETLIEAPDFASIDAEEVSGQVPRHSHRS